MGRTFNRNGDEFYEIMHTSLLLMAVRMDFFPALKKGKNTKQAERYRKAKCGVSMMMKYHKDPFEVSPEDMVDAVSVFNVIDIDENEDIDID